MVCFVALLETSQDLNGVEDRGLAHHYGLEAALQSCVPFDVLPVFIQGGGTDALELAAGECRLEDVCCIDCPFGGPCADQGVHFIDYEDHVAGATYLLHDFFEALLKFTPIFGAGHQ